MSVTDNKSIDSIALNNEQEAIILLITDHLDWEEEYKHLIVLQDKINAYINYWESLQYRELYPVEDIKYCIIEIHFKYELTPNAERFLQIVEEQVMETNINLLYYITAI